MGIFVAMLRSINVGGRNRVAMADLLALVGALGYRDAATYVQSGNVVFSGSGSTAGVARSIEQRIVSDLGLTVPVVVRSRSQWKRTLAANPFADLDVDPKTLHVTFLSASPDPKGVQGLEDGAFGSDELTVVGTDVFLHCPGGYGETKLNNAFLERRLGATATTRNWRTVMKLGEMAGL
jgi:uncharacterized protein (DUF1697 family)